MVDEEKVKKLFGRFDENNNGVLEKKEFFNVFKFLLKELGENMPEKKHTQVAEEAMKQFDLDQNGVIDYNEFIEVIQFLVCEKGYELK